MVGWKVVSTLRNEGKKPEHFQFSKIGKTHELFTVSMELLFLKRASEKAENLSGRHFLLVSYFSIFRLRSASQSVINFY